MAAMIQKPRMTGKPARFLYYAASALTLLAGLRVSWLAAAAGTVLRPGRPRRVRLRRSGPSFFVRTPMDIWTIKEVCLDRDYERVGVAIEPGWVVIDIGAGIGEFAIDTAIRHPSSVVHAFEPSPGSYALLGRNVLLNDVRNVRTYAVAVTGVGGVARLDISADDGAAHHVVATASTGAAPGEVTVQAATLAGVLDDLRLASCDFLKIDCEGGEYPLLLAADEATLSRVARICLEYHDGPQGTHEQLVDHLTAAGFRVSRTGSRAYREIGFLYAWRP